jgi:hypothetical protein
VTSFIAFVTTNLPGIVIPPCPPCLHMDFKGIITSVLFAVSNAGNKTSAYKKGSEL